MEGKQNNSKLRKCKACGHEIAKGGKIVCPSCGKVNKVAIYKRPWFIIIAIVVVLGLIGASSSDSEEVASSENSSSSSNSGTSVDTEEVKEVEVIEPVVVTVNDMVDLLKTNALKAEKTFKDQYVEVKGVVENIDSSGDYFSIGIIPQSEFDFEIYNVQCYIKDEHLDKVMEFETGQQVTVIGKISSVGEILGYSLKVDSIK